MERCVDGHFELTFVFTGASTHKSHGPTIRNLHPHAGAKESLIFLNCLLSLQEVIP